MHIYILMYAEQACTSVIYTCPYTILQIAIFDHICIYLSIFVYMCIYLYMYIYIYIWYMWNSLSCLSWESPWARWRIQEHIYWGNKDPHYFDVKTKGFGYVLTHCYIPKNSAEAYWICSEKTCWGEVCTKKRQALAKLAQISEKDPGIVGSRCTYIVY